MWKSVGAVAVYNRRRATFALIATVLGLFGAGLVLGLVVGGGGSDGGDATAATAEPAPAKTVDSTTANTSYAPPKADADAVKEARDRAYARGFKDGAKSTFPKDEDFKAGDAYMIRLKRGPGGAVVVGPNLEVVAGKEYFLCGGGERLCIRTPK